MSSLFARSFALVVIGIGSALAAPSLQAQVGTPVSPDSGAVRIAESTSPASDVRVDSLSMTGPRVMRAGVSVPVAVRSDLATPQGSNDNIGAGRNVAMMGVGVAAIVVGSLIGGDGGTVIAIGGGVIGLVGLFRYLR
jgi:hypothetical protein